MTLLYSKSKAEDMTHLYGKSNITHLYSKRNAEDMTHLDSKSNAEDMSHLYSKSNPEDMNLFWQECWIGKSTANAEDMTSPGDSNAKEVTQSWQKHCSRFDLHLTRRFYSHLATTMQKI
jgi:hypothetical protein